MKSKDTKREEALIRNKAWAELSTKEKLRRLRKRVGNSSKQITRINSQGEQTHGS